MKLSIFTTMKNPSLRGDDWKNSMRCYSELADEVVIVNGGDDLGLNTSQYKNTELKIIKHEWPDEFNWPLIGEQFQRGYDACTGDWVIHTDLDYLFHEKDFHDIRLLLNFYADSPAVSFLKWQFIRPDRYNLKSRLALAVNKRNFGDRIKFNGGGDLCQPTLDGQKIDPGECSQSRIPFYNYEKMTKNLDQIMDDCGRMDRAYHRHFGEWQLSTDASGSDESCFDGYMLLMKGRLTNNQTPIKLDAHPKYIQGTIRNLTPDQFGFNGFGAFGDSDYMKELVNA